VQYEPCEPSVGSWAVSQTPLQHGV
jgi:hypothetical protein